MTTKQLDKKAKELERELNRSQSTKEFRQAIHAALQEMFLDGQRSIIHLRPGDVGEYR